MGDGKWGQSDLVGNAWEWTLDWLAPYPYPCSDCASLVASSGRVFRGGAFNDDATDVLVSNRPADVPTARYSNTGARCARTP